MVKYVKKIEDFWTDNLNVYSYVRQVPYFDMRNGEHWHKNFKSGHLLQSVENELPQCYHQFKTELECNVDKSVVSWICIQPGQCIAPHYDTFYQLLKKNNQSLIEQCVRYLVFLEDWVFGQIVDFDSTVIKKWSKGDVWSFTHSDIHWACNSSNSNFHTCQINTIVT